MSMNIHLMAWLPTSTTTKNGKLINSKLEEKFDCIQTPTNITKWIIEEHHEDNRYFAYCEYILDRFKDITEEKYIYENEEDYLCENGPIEIINENVGERHIKELDKFLETYKDWNIEWFSF